MTQRRLHTVRLGALGAVLALALAGCGSSDDGDASAATTDAVADAAPIESRSSVTDSVGGAALTESRLSVTDAWSRQPAPGQTTAAVYARVSNGTDEDRQIVAVTTTVTARAELHETVIYSNGVARMQARADGFSLAAGETLMFEPGGAHVMLHDIDPATLGETIDIVFAFDGGETIAVVAEVRNDFAADDPDHHDTDHHDPDHHDPDHHDTDPDDPDHHDTDPDDPDHDAAEAPAFDAALLHEVDDELLAGTLDPTKQRPIIADYIAELEALKPAVDSTTYELLALLVDLDAALEQADLAAASKLATAAHDLAHLLEGHHH